MPRPLATLALWTAVTGLAQAATPPTVQDFTGTWRIAAIIGASEGGVTGADPKRMLGKHVQWTATNVRSPKGDCHLQHPALTPMPNRSLETGVWGGQTISELKLSRTDLAKAFGAQQTPVFQDPSGCANAVLIDHEHMVDAFGSGWIFRLDRVPNS